MKKLAFALSALLVSISCVFAQGVGQRITPSNFCSISSPASATGLTGFTCDTALPAVITYSYAIFCVYTQGVVWKDNGTPTATAGTGGTGVSAGQCFSYNGNLAKIQFIQQTAGAIVSASLYK